MERGGESGAAMIGFDDDRVSLEKKREEVGMRQKRGEARVVHFEQPVRGNRDAAAQASTARVWII